MTASHRSQVFEILAAIIHLGELDFTELQNEELQVTNSKHLGFAAMLLGIETNSLRNTFLQKQVKAKDSVIEIFR